MPLKLSYKDRYRLWHDLVRGSTDRLFIATAERPPLKSRAPIEVRIGDQTLPIVVAAQVVGWRGRSARFAEGIYVRISGTELEKCRRFLGLQPTSDLYRRTRKNVRVRCEVPIRFLDVEGAGAAVTRNLSLGGAFVRTPTRLTPGMRVRLELGLDDGPAELAAEVAWAATGQEACGLQFVDPPPDTSARLSQFLLETLEAQRLGQQQPRPILIADDDHDILSFVSTALSKHGYEVYQASNGAETMELVRHLQPSLVLLDILMPGIDGAEICKAMRADAELADLPVIFLSALEPESLHAVADEAGATDYLTKPLHLSDLINVIGRYLQG